MSVPFLMKGMAGPHKCVGCFLLKLKQERLKIFQTYFFLLFIINFCNPLSVDLTLFYLRSGS